MSFKQDKYQVRKFRIHRHFIKSVNWSSFPVSGFVWRIPQQLSHLLDLFTHRTSKCRFSILVHTFQLFLLNVNMLVCLNNIHSRTLRRTAESNGESKNVLGCVEGSNEHRVLDLMKQSLCLRLRPSARHISFCFCLEQYFRGKAEELHKGLHSIEMQCDASTIVSHKEA